MCAAVDPLASLRPWTLTVDVGGETYRLEPRNSADWLAVLLQEEIDLADILPGMLDEEGEERLGEALIEGLVSTDEIRECALEIIGTASGRDHWWTLNLTRSVMEVWTQVYGQLISQGVRFDQLPLGAALDAMYAVVASRMDKERLRSFDADLSRPPAGTPLSEEDESDQFLAAMNAMKAT